MMVFQDILRKYREEYKEIIQILETATEQITETEAKVAFIWILGEFGEYIDDAPYMLESLVDSLKDNSDGPKVKRILLTACVRLFLNRPPEMISTLKNLVSQIISDENEDFDLKDRAIFYCKALQYDLVDLKKALDEKKSMDDMFVEEEEIKKEGATLEFNTLSVIFRKPANKFVKSLADMDLMKTKEQEELQAQQEQAQAQNRQDGESQQDAKPDLYGKEGEAYDNNLLDIDNPDQLATGGDQGGQYAPITPEDLGNAFDFDPQTFQEQWSQMAPCAKSLRILQNIEAITVERVEEALSTKNVFCIASGEKDGELRFYFYSKYEKTGSVLLMELQIVRSRKELNLMVKSENEDLGPYFSKYIEDNFRSWQLLA